MNFEFVKGGTKINRKSIAISLVALAALSAVFGVVTMTALADTNSTSTDSTTTATATPTATPTTTTNMTTAPLGDGMQMMDQGFMGGQGDRGHGMNSMGGTGGVEISSEYNATITAILENDTDVANLLSQGYNITTIHPIIKTVVAGDGTVTEKATTATVTLTNGTTGYATVSVDIENSKVTYITITTRTVIDKSSS